VRSDDVITTDAQVAGVVRAAQEAGRMGLDTEFLRERTYRARLCLVQIATPHLIAIIDPLAEVELAPVAALVADPRVEVVVHAGRQDLDILHDRFGRTPRNVFDVQWAAGFAGYGASLPYGRLVESVVGAELEKGESYSDWCRRPLTRQQISYAADDVRYLLAIADRLRARLEDLGRTEWVAEEMAWLEAPSSYGMRPEEAWRKVSGRGALSSRQAAVLKELAGWREKAAAARDIPRNWLIKDPSLIEMARRQPDSIGALKAIRGVNAKEAERSGRALLAAIQAGQRAPATDGRAAAWPRPVLVRARMTAALADAVIRSRCERAGVATELVATRGEIESLLSEVYADRLDPGRHRLLRGWRQDLAGDSVLALARGEIAVRATDVPPYVEEVPVDGRG
jgi:ribonuclease D